MEITLSVTESILLREILEQHQRELLREISRSSHHEFKQVLREKEHGLNSILDRLKLAGISDAALAGRN